MYLLYFEPWSVEAEISTFDDSDNFGYNLDFVISCQKDSEENVNFTSDIETEELFYDTVAKPETLDISEFTRRIISLIQAKNTPTATADA